MPLLLHLTPERNAQRIRRAGIAAVSRSAAGGAGVYCTPLLPSHTLTYQWSRELLRNRARPFAAVHFRVPDDQPVTVGPYNDRAPRQVTAAEAVGVILRLADPRGWQIFLPRAVTAAEIHRVRTIARPIGWRYRPDAHGRRPCACPACGVTGGFKSADLRERFPLNSPRQPREEVLQALRTTAADPAATDEQIIDLLWSLHSRGKGDAFRLAFLVEHPSGAVRAELALLLQNFRGPTAARLLEQLRQDPDAEVREAAEDGG